MEFPSAEKLISHSHSLQFIVEIAEVKQEKEDDGGDQEAISSNGGLRLSDVFEKLHKFCTSRGISFTVSQTLLDRAFEQLLADQNESHLNLGYVNGTGSQENIV